MLGDERALKMAPQLKKQPTIASRLVATFGALVVWASIFMRVTHRIFVHIPDPGFLLTSIGIGMFYLSLHLKRNKPVILPPTDLASKAKIRNMVWAKRLSLLLQLASFGLAILGISQAFNSPLNGLYITSGAFAIFVAAVLILAWSTLSYSALLAKSKTDNYP